jgi:hypothetical protein
MSEKSLDAVKLARALAHSDSQRGFLHHLRHLVVDSSPEPARFSTVARHWQWEQAARLAPILEDVMGVAEGRSYDGPRCFWRTLARGHDKTSSLGRLCNYALMYSRRRLEIDVAAADRDQAALLTEAMWKESELNWFKDRLKFMKGEVRGPGGRVNVLTADAPTAAGRKPDILICDEITHWGGKALWDMLYSGLSKRPHALCVVITNAGVRDTWQWDIKEMAKTQPRRWEVYEAPGRLDTWMSESDLAADRLLLTPSEARRLLDNVWVDPAEESGFLSREDLEECERLGVELGLSYALRGRPGAEYWAGIDYGPKRDRTGLSVLHQRPSGLIVVDRLDVWQGSPGAPVLIADIRAWVRAAREDFPGLSLIVDPYQLDEMCQDLGRSMRVERFEARGGKGNYEMAEALRSLVVNRSIAWYPGAGSLEMPDGTVEDIKKELLSLITRPMSYGYRFDHEATKHDDRAVAVGMAAWRLLQGPGHQTFKAPPAVERPANRVVNFRTQRAEARGLYGMGLKNHPAS